MAFSYDEIARYQWFTSTQTVTLAEAEVARMIYWCKTPDKEAIPDLVEMISLYAQASDCSERLDHTPIQIDDDVKEELAKTGVLDIQAIRNKCAELDGFMFASERFRTELYQRTFNEQLAAEIVSLRTTIDKLPDRELDDDELDDLLYTRDLLEYARIGLNVIRMERRLLGVQYDQFAAELEKLDERLRDYLEKQNDQPLPYAPSTFWWRKV